MVGCMLAPRPKSYGHKRHPQLNNNADGTRRVNKPQLRIWDFVLTREDGSALRLHPQWTTTKVETFAAEGHNTAVAVPQAGLGNSDGRGTYRLYKDIGMGYMIRFDASKKKSP